MRNLKSIEDRLPNVYEDATIVAEWLARRAERSLGEDYLTLENSYDKLYNSVIEFLTAVDEFESTVEPIFNKHTYHI